MATADNGQRWVLHIDMDAFYASCEQLTRPGLRGRPVLVGGASGRGVVAGASYEARAFGARSAMPMHQAKERVGFAAVVVRPRRAVYQAASARVFEVVARRVDVIERLSIDEAYLEPEEIQGADEDTVRRFIDELRQEIKDETGLAASVGAGSGKQIAKIGSGEAKPDGALVVAKDEEREWLAEMPVGKLWGVGPVTRGALNAAGIETIGQFAALTRREAKEIVGTSVGGQLWELARGHDDRPVEPPAEAKQVSAERTFERDLVDRRAVDDAVDDAARAAFRRLQRDGRGARTVTVKLRLADFKASSRSGTLPSATDSFETLLAAAKQLVRYPDEVGPIRLVGVGFAGLEEARQDSLFPDLDLAVTSHLHTPEEEPDDLEVGVSGPLVTGDEAAPVAPPQQHAPDTAASNGPRWLNTQDVSHPDHGHGWVQGSGHGRVTVRFETRTTTRSVTRTFPDDDPDLEPADPLDSLDWDDWLAARDPIEPEGNDPGGGMR